jgi:hypothetical protein
MIRRTKRTLRLLSQLEYHILKAVAHRIVPAAVRCRGLDLAWKIDVILAGVSKRMGQEFKLLLLVFEYGTVLLGPSFKRFTQMSEAEQDRYLTNWAHSRLPFKRMGFQVLKRSVLAAYYGSRRVWSRIGYGGPWLRRGYPHDYPGKDLVRLHGR